MWLRIVFWVWDLIESKAVKAVINIHPMAFLIQLLCLPELMGMYLVSSKMHCRVKTFEYQQYEKTLLVRDSFAQYHDLQQVFTDFFLIKLV